MFELNGRKFAVIECGTVKHDYWLMKQIREAGIESVDFPADRDMVHMVDALIDRVLASGAAMVLLGGLIMPAEMKVTEWTPAIAAEMTAFLESLTATADKELVRGLVAQAMVGFFRSALVSLRTSRTSSLEAGAVAESRTSTPASAGA